MGEPSLSATTQRLQALVAGHVVRWPAEKSPLPPLPPAPVPEEVPAWAVGHRLDTVFVVAGKRLVHERRDCAEATGRVRCRTRVEVRRRPSCPDCRTRRWD